MFRTRIKSIAFLAGLLLLLPAMPLVQDAMASPKGARWGESYFPNFTVTDQNGRTYRFYDDLIKNKRVVINFIYTSCPDICGLQTARLALVYERLGDSVGRDVHFYSISLDPERDTPAALKKFADAFDAGPGWLFLTGQPDQLHQIRYKLGERSRSLAEHRNDAVMGNDITGEWARNSVMSNIALLAQRVREMDPAYRKTKRQSKMQYAKARKYSLGNQPGQGLFLKACAVCHTIGMGDHVGPDLEGVTSRRDHDWLVRYLMAPDQMRASNDPLAVSLGDKYPGVVMPNLSLAKTDAGDLISYLKAQTKRLAAKPAAVATSQMQHRGSHGGSGSMADTRGSH